MSSFACGLLLFATVSGAIESGTATEFRYTGVLTRVERGGERPMVKQFEVYCLLSPGTAEGRELFYLVDEGGNGWPWPERFGTIPYDSSYQTANRPGIRLLHTHDGSDYPLDFGHPLFSGTAKLKEGATWNHNGVAYEVSRQKRVGESDCWQVEVNPAQARRQTLWIEQGTPLVVSAQKRVFMGRGDEFELRYELDGIRKLDAAEWDRLETPIETLTELKAALARDDETTQPELSAAQLEKTSALLEQLEKEAEGTTFQRFAAVISRDVKSQSQRESDVSQLSQKMLGQEAPPFELEALEQPPIDSKKLAGKIVVLHFWNYNDDPLVEPYGQVGYLDFLHGRRHKLGVEVVGVAVNSLTEDPAKRPAAMRSIRKLQRFMNLSYPIAADDGSLLRRFGDPRTLNAKLPLWVVIGADGKVAHFHVGFYDIRPDEGLKSLDEVVVELIRQQRDTN